MKLEILSFGHKYGLPQADMVFDMRCLENPFWVPELREKNGLELPVREFILQRSERYIEKLTEFLTLQLHLAEGRGCEKLRIAVGCTGGRHRSVCVAKLLAEHFTEQGHEVVLSHRDIHRE